MSQSFKYKKPVYIGDEIMATVRLSVANINRRVVKFITTGEDQIYVPVA
jgi:hypothetical protein